MAYMNFLMKYIIIGQVFLKLLEMKNKVIWNIGLIMMILLLFILIIIIGTVIHIGAAAIGIG